MTREIESSRSELVQQLNRRNDFSNRVEALKFEYEKLAAERRSILAEKGECTASIASLQEEVVFLKRLIKEAENDLETHILLNETIRTQNKKAETEVEHLAGSRDTLLRALQNERIAVQQEERLIAELKNSLSRFRSEKAQMTQDGAVLLERSRNLTQDRMMLMSAVTQDQAELLNLRGSLCDLKDQKRALSLEVQSKAFTAVESRQGLPRSSHRPDRPARDRKGIKFQPPPNLQTQGLQAQVNPNVPLMQYPHKDTWTRFEASTCPAAPVREDRGGIGDILGRALSNRAEDSTSLVRLPDKSSEGSRSARPESRFSSMTDPFKALDEAPAFGQPVSSCQH
ncbi:MAG: uncharacterized protein KVP18_000302 [Porospora cf. gigantea A]|nr:MAG: hypothetical protein KVP18_000302 [Porospora cf. gigantea A]